MKKTHDGGRPRPRAGREKRSKLSTRPGGERRAATESIASLIHARLPSFATKAIVDLELQPKFPVRVSALRERPESIPLLVRHFVQQFSRHMNKGIDTIPSETMTALMRYPWPGNVRELQNVIERAVIISTGLILELSTEELHLRTDVPPVSNHRNETNGKVSGPNGAAALLGRVRSTLQFRMQKLGIIKFRCLQTINA